MNVIDLALLLGVIAGTLAGLASGFVKAAANLVGLVMGFVIGSFYFPWLAPLFVLWTGRVGLASLLAFTLIALLVAVALEGVGHQASQRVHTLELQSVNRRLGMLPAAASAILLAGITLALLNGFSVFERERAESRLSGWFLQVSAPVIDLLPPPWNGAPQKLPPPPIRAPDAPAMADVARKKFSRDHARTFSSIDNDLRNALESRASGFSGGTVFYSLGGFRDGHEEVFWQEEEQLHQQKDQEELRQEEVTSSTSPKKGWGG